MDKSAIEHIQNTFGIDQAIEQVRYATPEKPIIALPQGINVVSLEKYMPCKIHYEKNFKTNCLASFIDYCTNQIDQDLPVLTVQPEPSVMAAQCVFDIGTIGEPLHKLHTASLGLKPRYDYRVLMEAANTRMNQKTLAEFILDNTDNIDVFDSERNPINNSVAIELIRNMTIDSARAMKSKVGDYSDEMSVSEKIEAQNIPKLPALIVFRTIPFESFGEYRFDLRLSIDLGDERPVFSLRASNLESTQQKIGDDFEQMIRDALTSTEITVYQGII